MASLIIAAIGLAFTIFVPLLNWRDEKDQRNRLVLELKEYDANLSTQNLSSCSYCEKITLTYKSSFSKSNCEGDRTCEQIVKKIENCTRLISSSSNIGIQDIIRAHATAESSSLHNDIIKFMKLFEAASDFERCIINEKYAKVEPYYKLMINQMKQYTSWTFESSTAIKNKDRQLAQYLLEQQQSIHIFPDIHDSRYPRDILNELRTLLHASTQKPENEPKVAYSQPPSTPALQKKYNADKETSPIKTSIFMQYNKSSDPILQFFISTLRSELQEKNFTLDSDIEHSDILIKLTNLRANINQADSNHDGIQYISSLTADIHGQNIAQSTFHFTEKGEWTDEKTAIQLSLKNLASTIASKASSLATKKHTQNKEIPQ